MPDQQTYSDAPLTPDQVKAVGYTDAPLTDAHPWITAAKDMIAKAFPPEKPRRDSNIATVADVGIAPEDVLMVGQGLAHVGDAVRAGVGAAGKIAAGAKSVAVQTAPVVKYQLAKSGLEGLGVPSSIAIPIAMAASGYKSSPKSGQTIEQAVDEAVASKTLRMHPHPGESPLEFSRRLKAEYRAANPASAPAAPASPVASAPAPPAPGVEPTAPPSAPPPSAESAASPIRMGPDGRLVGRPGGNPDLPDQRALNEAAIAERRAAMQAPAKPANVKLNAAETSAYLNLMLKGKSSSEAMASVLQQRELIAALGTPTPTPEQTRFPKGQRGKVSPQ